MSSITIRPVRPYQRLQPATVIHSGVSAGGNYLAFTQKDVFQNIDVHRDNRQKERYSDRKLRAKSEMTGKVPVGTTVCTYKMGGLDKSAKLDRTKFGISEQRFPRNPTDAFSSIAPAYDRPF